MASSGWFPYLALYSIQSWSAGFPTKKSITISLPHLLVQLGSKTITILQKPLSHTSSLHRDSYSDTTYCRSRTWSWHSPPFPPRGQRACKLGVPLKHVCHFMVHEGGEKRLGLIVTGDCRMCRVRRRLCWCCCHLRMQTLGRPFLRRRRIL